MEGSPGSEYFDRFSWSRATIILFKVRANASLLCVALVLHVLFHYFKWLPAYGCDEIVVRPQ